MMSRPRIAERLLEAVGADTEFRDAVLGDLREEYAIRATYGGEDEARRWYRREALRTAPHLVRDRLRSLRLRDLKGLAGRAVTAHVLVTVASTVFFIIGRIVVDLPGGPSGPSRLHPALLAILPLLRLLTPVGGGYLAAWLDDERPLAASVAYAVLGALGSLVAIAGFGGSIEARHVIIMLVAAAFSFAASVAGGVLRVVQKAREERSPIAG